MTTRVLLAWLCGSVALGCGGSDESSPEQPPESNLAFSAKTFAVAPGTDKTMCSYVRATNDAPLTIKSLRAWQKQGGHHVVVYAVDHRVDLDQVACPQGGQYGWTSLGVAAGESSSFQFPEKVGLKIDAHQQFVIETHYINATTEEAVAESGFEIGIAEAGEVEHEAAPLFVGMLNFELKPSQTTEREVTCTLPTDLNVFNLYGHTHSLGRSLRAKRSAAGGAPAEFYDMGNWEKPSVIESERFEAGESISVACSWDNPTGESIGYPGEMCHLVGFYWPGDGDKRCLTHGSTDDCECWSGTDHMDRGSGGSSLVLSVSRKEEIAGAAGDPSESHPIYCYLWRKVDFEKDGLTAAIAYWTNVDEAQLTSAADTVEMTMYDVTPGDYLASCYMDTVYGGAVVTKGGLVAYPYVPVTVGADGLAIDVELNLAAPQDYRFTK